MQELIKIDVGVLGVDTVNAKDLYDFLECKTQFAEWIKNRISVYGFEKGKDYIVLKETLKNLNGGRPSENYHISVDMAKELSMVERNEKGKQARTYFIECERQVKQIESKVPSNFAEALQLAADQAKQLEEQRPKVEFAEKVETSVNSISVAEFANLLTKNGYKIGQNNLFKWFYENGYLIKRNWVLC